MKLKTLKEIVWDERGKGYDEDKVTNVKELKAEAVKWVKMWKSFKRDVYLEGRINAFVDFFNITEEELTQKEGGGDNGN